MTVVELLSRRTAALVLAQAARVIELAARRGGRTVEIGSDTPPGEEPLRFVASDRMALTASDIAAIGEVDGQPHVTANVLGLAGAAPALPPVYSELQLQRRRMRDVAFAAFLNLFDHRALSFFYRVFRKHHWLVSFEREARPGDDPASRAVLALAGLATPGSMTRLVVEDAALVPLAGHLGDARRSAASVETVLRQLTGLPLRIAEAEPAWLALPPTEQSRLGGTRAGGGGQFARLGGIDPQTGMGSDDAAIIGAAVLDVQHHYAVEIGPVDHATLIRFCAESGQRAIVGEACMLAAGMEHQPVIRMLIDAADIPPLRLGDAATPALLGWTGWLGSPGPDAGILADCVIPVDRTAIGRDGPGRTPPATAAGETRERMVALN